MVVFWETNKNNFEKDTISICGEKFVIRWNVAGGWKKNPELEMGIKVNWQQYNF